MAIRVDGADTPVVELGVPGDKSITIRALILSTLARGTSVVGGLLASEDAQATAAALRAFGAPIPELTTDGRTLALTGIGVHGLASPGEAIDCGNSGTLARLLLGVLAGCSFPAVVTGDASLRARPMRRITEPLARMGARIDELGDPDRLPIRITGGELRPIEYASPHASAQVKSALLLAGLTGGVPVQVTEPLASRDHTELMLRAMGANLSNERGPGGENIVRLEPPEFLEPLHCDVPGDFSSAAFFLALGALSPRVGVRVKGVGVNPTRTGFLDVLRRMGGQIYLDNACDQCEEPVADATVYPSRLRATSIGAEEIPALIDEIPILAILAARAEGETRITGAAELRVKESDRIRAIATNLKSVGVGVEELDDGLLIRGTDAPCTGRVSAFGDHRIAMAFGILGALPGNSIEIDDPGVAAVSFPGFWDRLREVQETFFP